MQSFKSGIGYYVGLTVLFLCILANASRAVELQQFETEQSEVQILAVRDTEKKGEGGWLGIRFVLKPGWKTYWRHPGDAGAPMTVDWSKSENLDVKPFLWPAHKRYVEPWGMDVYGYKDEVIFPAGFSVADPAKPVRLKGTVHYTLCAELCIPYSHEVDAVIPMDVEVNKAHKASIDAALASVPKASGANGLSIDRVMLEVENDPETEVTGYLVAEISSDTGLVEPDLFVEKVADYRFAKPEPTLIEAGAKALLRVPYSPMFDKAAWPSTPVRLTLVDGKRAVELEKTLALVSTDTQQVELVAVGGDQWILMLLFAWLGGLILNVMPCVLPVLSLKVMDVLRHQEAGKGAVRVSFLASGLGIVSFFLLLAFGAMLLREAGMAIGWGFHFQEPAFLITLALVLVLFAANMWGWFEITLPHWLGGHVTDTGKQGGLVGHFLTGAFAAVLATPCTAPFLGTAVGFALAQPVSSMFLLFAVMGGGLATPYLLVAVFPGAVRWFPKPGNWMVTVKWVLGLFLFFTAIWLFWVLAAQIGSFGATLTAIISGLVTLKIVLMQRHYTGATARKVLTAVIVGLLFIVYMLPERFDVPMQRVENGELEWQVFDEAAIDAALAGGKVVFVDVTADWCLTCKFNKKTVLESEVITELFSKPDIVLMRADWTRHDDAITAYLKRHGRGGIPMNVVYGPNAPEGIVLSEVLTKDAVREAVHKAAKYIQ